ncbi:Dynein light chain roadblock-type 2 [Taenia crassiceps]|uniref:Dynein light chain roadblock-type 2 n=1 Tax=Taenia crassiceps TaxID=6207 RepID=A0ABR4QL92_9CEST
MFLVSPDRLNLEKCQYCNRRFFSQSLQKHSAACEREWMRENFANGKKSENAPGPKIKEHVTGYDVNVKTFADMLALGAERRMRWRMRHEEFIHTIKTAKANLQRARDGIPEVVEPLISEVAQAGLTQCECCGRRFNDAAFMKHKDQCKAKQTGLQSDQTEEQKEAKLRFLKRMKYNLKLTGKMKVEDNPEGEKGTDESLKADSGEVVHSSANEALVSSQESEILNKLAAKICHGLDFSKALSSDLLQSNVFNSLVRHNLSALIANAALQISNCNHVSGTDSSTSLPFFSASSLESTSAAPSAVIDTEEFPATSKSNQQNEKAAPPQLCGSETAVRVDAATARRKSPTPSASAKAISSFHHTNSHRSIKPPPTVVNNFMNEMNGEDTLRRQHNAREERDAGSRGCGSANGEKPEVMVLPETSKHHNQKHNLKRNESHKVSESDQNSRVVFYKFNSASTDFSQDNKTSQKKYPLHLKIPHQTDGESNATTVLGREGGVNNASLRMAVQETEAAGVPSCRHTPSARSSGHSDVAYDSQSLVPRSHHRSGHHHHRRKNPEPVGTPRSRGSSQSHHSQGNCGSDDGGKKSASRYCPQCGKKFPSKARFCSFCGAMRKSKVATGASFAGKSRPCEAITAECKHFADNLKGHTPPSANSSVFHQCAYPEFPNFIRSDTAHENGKANYGGLSYRGTAELIANSRADCHKQPADDLYNTEEGNPIRSNMDNSTSLQYTRHAEELRAMTQHVVRDLDPEDELVVLRLRTRMNEVMILPGKSESAPYAA